MTLAQTIRQKIHRQRLLFGCLTGACFLLFVVFFYLYTASARIEHVGSGYFGYDKVTHDTGYGVAAVVALFLGMWTACIWAGTGFCRCVSAQCGGDTVLVHRGLLGNYLYINEKEADRMGPLTFRYYMEGRLCDGSTVTVALSRYRAVKLVFSNGQPSVEL